MRLPAWHRSKIVCTLGPATDPPGVLSKLIHAGMDVARMNFSHGTNEDLARRIVAVRAAAKDARQPVAILADLPGPKFRLAEITAGARTLREGEQVALVAGPGGATDLPVRNPKSCRYSRREKPCSSPMAPLSFAWLRPTARESYAKTRLRHGALRLGNQRS